MLRIFRKARKLCVALITLTLLLPVQQSLAQNLDELDFTSSSGILSMSIEQNSEMDMDMTHCKNSGQQDSCCDENACDSNNCSSTSSFLALFLIHDMSYSYVPQQPEFSVRQREITIVLSELFRPPRNIQS